MNKNLWPIVTGIIVILFGLFVWPTMYQYDKMNQKWPVRINRFTGEAEMLNANGWQKLSETPTTQNQNSVSSQPVIATQPTSPPTRPELIVENTKAVGSGSLIHVTGEVQNVGNAPSRFTIINATIYNQDGSVAGSGTGSVSVIAPHQTQSFDALVAIGKEYNGTWPYKVKAVVSP